VSIQDVRGRAIGAPPRRTAPFEEEPGYYEPSGIWMYGNIKLVRGLLACVPQAFGPECHAPVQLEAIERETEKLVLSGSVIVCGIHNSAHQRSAIVPLRWGAPRIVVLSGGFYHHLGKGLNEEPFRAARLWRYAWDPKTDLAVSRRAPNKLPTYATHNSTVDRLVLMLVMGEVPGHLFGCNRHPDSGVLASA